MATKAKKRKKWTRRRHRAVFAFFRAIFRPHTRCRYNFKAQRCNIKPPFLLLCNHVTTFDPIFAALSFKCPVYFCAMDDLFNMKFVSPILRYLAAPIPKKKSVVDAQAIRDILTVLREGGAVGLFPEGNRTLSSGLWSIGSGIAKLVKKSAVPLVVYNIEGGYGADPRWGTSKRKGRMRGVIRRIVSPEEYSEMSNDELYALILDSLTVNDPNSGVRFKSRKRAENIERVLYMCPNCGSVSTITSKGVNFGCTHCGKQWEYTEDLHIAPSDNFFVIYDWYNWEKEEIVKFANSTNGEVFVDDNIELYRSIRFKKKQKVAGKRITADKYGFTIYDGEVSMRCPFEQVEALALVHRNKFDFYFNGETYQVRGDERFCSIKYVHLFEGIKNVQNQ